MLSCNSQNALRSSLPHVREATSVCSPAESCAEGHTLVYVSLRLNGGCLTDEGPTMKSSSAVLE